MSEKKRLINDLRVIDLRAELDKRNLDKSGVRNVLVLRLSKHLEEEGLDPATYKFELAADAKTPSKKGKRSESTVEQESEEAPAMEDMIVQDDAGEEEESELTENKKKTESSTASQSKMEVDEEKAKRKRELKDDSEATQPKKPCLDKEPKNEDDSKAENNTDAEDSINLDIGDDELLNEEADNNTKTNNKNGQDILCKQDSRMKTCKKVCEASFEDCGSTGQAARDSGERPALTRLINATDVDEAADDYTAEAACDTAATADGDATAGDGPADDAQVNSEANATSNEGERNENDQKDEKDKEGDSDKKEKKDDSKEGGARNLWVSGLSGDTRAKDLKQLCSKHGKVIGAKVVTNARTPGSRCYGYVTMASSQDAENCIKNLHRTELHGRLISVEKAKSESESSSRRQPSRSERRSSRDRKEETKENEGEAKEGGEKTAESIPKKDGEVSGAESNRSVSRSREKSNRSDKDRGKRSTRSRERRRSPREILSFPKIWKERDVARARERSRAAREEERRRRAAEDALRERERRQRQEKHRLALEREKLRAEREKIEREKNELLRLERERHRLEREKLELERLELKRAQLRLEEERRKRYEGGYRKPGGSPPPEPAYDRERHKRPPQPPMSSGRVPFEAPPPPRFEMAASYDRGADKRDRDRDYKRDYPRHVSSGNMKYSSNGGTNDDSRQPMPPGTRPKEPSGRAYEPREGGARGYRSPPAKPDPRWPAPARYPDQHPPNKGSSGGGSEPWAGGGGEARYAYEQRYPAQYQPPPPGAPYPDRYAPRDYPRKY